jgi:hypothetical protein
MDAPEVRYAKSGDVSIAYSVVGDGRVKDLVACSDIRFEERGVTELKGAPGEWRLFAVVR